MDIYHWAENNKNYYAVENYLDSDTDDIFIEFVDNEIALYDQEESNTWLVFWVSDQHAKILNRLFPVQYDKPETDIAKFKSEANRGFEAAEKKLSDEFTQSWGEVNPLNVNLHDVNKQAEKMLREHVKNSMSSPRKNEEDF